MNVIRFNITTFEDIKIYGLTNIINDLFNFMSEEIIKEKTIVIERRYSNADPDTVRFIRTTEELNLFKSSLQ
jgi:hypothetical protein